MKVYTYRASLWCEPCGEHIKRHLPKPAHVDEDNEYSYDSDDWPKGPDEVGEADCADHCTACGVFLENRLTDEGVENVEKQIWKHGPDLPEATFYAPDYSSIRVAVDRVRVCRLLDKGDWLDALEALHVSDLYDLGVRPGA